MEHRGEVSAHASESDYELQILYTEPAFGELLDEFEIEVDEGSKWLLEILVVSRVLFIRFKTADYQM